MCLIVFAWQAHPRYRLVLAGNRDEFHARPAAPLDWWKDAPHIVGGRDMKAGGTWLAVARSGRVATVTNYREDLAPHPGTRSRGALVTRFLADDRSPLCYAEALEGADYAGFSLLAGDLRPHPAPELAYVSNRGDPARALAPGIYGLSNASLDTPWPKLLRSKARLASLLEGPIDPEALLALLADREPGNSDDIADAIADDLPPETARAIAAPFVVTPEYGTRCSTVLLASVTGEIDIHERRFDPGGVPAGDSHVHFAMASR